MKREGGHTHLRSKYFNTWLREAYPKSSPTPPPPTQTIKMDETCGVGPVHVGARNFPCRSGIEILILIPKGNKFNLRIGLLEVLWKVMETLIVTRINKTVTLHDVFHGGGKPSWNWSSHRSWKVWTRTRSYWCSWTSEKRMRTCTMAVYWRPWRDIAQGQKYGAFWRISGHRRRCSFEKWLPWTPVQGDTQNQKGGYDISGTL